MAILFFSLYRRIEANLIMNVVVSEDDSLICHGSKQIVI